MTPGNYIMLMRQISPQGCSLGWSIVLAKIKFGLMCRGFGAAYIKFSVSGFKSELRAFSLSVELHNGREIPSSLYRVKKNGSFVAGILAIPLLGTAGHMVVRVYERESLVASKRLSWNALKWLSRLHYKMNNEEAHFIRDIDAETYTDQTHIRLNVFYEVPGKDEYLAKGIVCAPNQEVLPDIYLIDAQGNRIQDADFHFGSAGRSDLFNLDRVEKPFTLRVSKSVAPCCLVAETTSQVRSGFLCFDSASVERYLGSFSPYMYQVSSPARYSAVVDARERMLRGVSASDYVLDSNPLFSVIVPLYKTPLNFLNAMVESVQNQIYQNWELVLVNASPEIVELRDALHEFTDKRIKVVELEGNKGISDNTNAGMDAAQGDYIIFFDHDDVLDPFALYEYAKAINENPAIDALYCDEDFLSESGELIAPHFKSDFNIDLLRCHNYITHLLAVKAAFAKDLKLRRDFDGAQDYDFLLRLVEKTKHIHHVRKVLYHWRISDTSTAKSSGNKGYADEAGRKALQEHLDRLGMKATAESGDSACFYHVKYEVEGEPLVSIVIPTKDSVEVLSRCIDSIEEKTTYPNYEIVICENNSTEQETFEYYKRVVDKYSNVTVCTWEKEFNYSAINNFAVGFAKGEYLLLLNNDTEVIEPGWMSSMLSFCQREDVGAVGAKLLYPDDTVQHAGVTMIKCASPSDIGGAVHVFHDIDRDDCGYMRRASLNQDLTAVTAACMMTKRSTFEQLGGLDESFRVAFNDIDYCLRVRALGKLVVYDADALLYHYESFTRGYETGEKIARFMREQGRLRTAWAEYYVEGDPYCSEWAIRLNP